MTNRRDIFLKHLCVEIRYRRRHKLKIKPAHFSKLSGLSLHTLNRIELADKTVWSFHWFKCYATILGVETFREISSYSSKAPNERINYARPGKTARLYRLLKLIKFSRKNVEKKKLDVDWRFMFSFKIRIGGAGFCWGISKFFIFVFFVAGHIN